MSRAKLSLAAGMGLLSLGGHGSVLECRGSAETATVVAKRTTVEVRFVDENGRRWPLELWRRRMRGLAAIATLDVPTGPLPRVAVDSWREYGVGRWTPMPEVGGAAPRDIDGELTIEVDPPVVISAVLRHVVLQSRALLPAQTFVEFVLPRAAVEAQFAYARGRAVDHATGAPCVGAQVGLASTSERPVAVPLGADGTFELGPVLPGLSTLLFEGPSYEKVWLHVALAPGRNDLGAQRLTAASAISGRVVTAGLSNATVGVVAFAPEHRGPAPFLSRHTVITAADGTFIMRDVGRRQLIVVARSEAGPMGYCAVDATGGDVTGVELSLRAVTDVVVTARNPSGRGLTITFLAEARVPVAIARLAADVRDATVRIPAGMYRLQIEGDDTAIGQRDILVGSTPLRVDLDL